jgi:hypothetical protein
MIVGDSSEDHKNGTEEDPRRNGIRPINNSSCYNNTI